MTNQDAAIKVLQLTHDGNDLSQEQLKLIESATNNRITLDGRAALLQLLKDVLPMKMVKVEVELLDGKTVEWPAVCGRPDESMGRHFIKRGGVFHEITP